jgi:flagellar protein FlbD
MRVICVTRLNGTSVYLNAELIQSVEATPDTVITLTNGVKMVVRETPKQVVEEVVEYRREVNAGRDLSSGRG